MPITLPLTGWRDTKDTRVAIAARTFSETAEDFDQFILDN